MGGLECGCYFPRLALTEDKKLGAQCCRFVFSLLGDTQVWNGDTRKAMLLEGRVRFEPRFTFFSL